MDWAITLLVVVIITLLVGGAFATMGIRGPWSGILWFFVLLFFATWAIGTWVQPAGPVIWGVPWLTFLTVAVMIALLIAAATPSPRGGHRGRSHDELPLEGDSATTSAVGTHHHLTSDDKAATATVAAVGLFFWLAVVAAVAIIVVRVLFDAAP